MKLLIVDPVLAAAIAVAKDLKKSLDVASYCATSTEDALGRLESAKDTIGIIVYFLSDGPEAGISFIKKVREHCTTTAIRCPRFVLLVPGELSNGYPSKLTELGAACRACGNPTELHFTLRRLMFEAGREKGKTTIIVERRGRHTRFYLLGPAGRVLIPYGPRLLRIMNRLAISFGTMLSTAELAEAAEITESSVKVYLRRLVIGFDEVREKAGVSIHGKQIFCTFRKDGGFVHILRARVIFI